MNKIWVFSLEPLETRYTGEWYTHVPELLKQQLPEFEVHNLAGVQNNTEVSPGAFLNFSDTNYWKSSQILLFLRNLNRGLVGDNDHLVFTDAWNPGIMQIKYMRDLMGKNWVIHGLWHAGSYDPQDFLGRQIGNAEWVRNAETAMFHAIDHNYFASDSHVEMFVKTLLLNNSKKSSSPTIKKLIDSGKIVRTGWPMEYLSDIQAKTKKENLILFPHRVAPEKQVDIFRDLAASMPEYKFVVCQDKKLTRKQYHKLLNRAKIVFSANLQETLGISTCGEGPVCGAVPMAPDRLSYSEIFADTSFLYPSEWTESFAAYKKHKKKVVARIKTIMNNYSDYRKETKIYANGRMQEYFSANGLVNLIRKYIK